MILKFLEHSNVLKMLDLWMNILHGTIPATFAKVNTFRNINLNGNQLEGLLLQSLANYRNLKVLDLGSNKINGTFPYWLEGLLKLQVLAIRSKSLQGFIGNPKTKSPFPNLRIVGISNNDFWKSWQMWIKEKLLWNIWESSIIKILNIMIIGLHVELVTIKTIFTTLDFLNNSFTVDSRDNWNA